MSTSPRYVIDIIAMDTLSLGELEGGGNSEKIDFFIFLTYEGVIGS